MANSSLYAAFERMWQHIIIKLSDVREEKADKEHMQTISNGGTGETTIEDKIYIEPRYRASALVNYEPTLSYANAKDGVIYWIYE